MEKQEFIIIRKPKATRPWQHVLEPLGGYLLLASKMYEDNQRYSEAWNFGPDKKNHVTVKDITKKIVKNWKTVSSITYLTPNSRQPHESECLKLDTSKAKSYLKWRTVYDIDQTIDETINWYKSYYEKSSSLYDLSSEQIINYIKNAQKMKLLWSKEKK